MIDLNQLSALCKTHGMEIALAEPMAAHTSFKVGGACAALITIPSETALLLLYQYLIAEGIPHRLIGRGSNLLVPDDGYDGVVLKLGGDYAAAPVMEENRIRCGCGTSLKGLCMAALHASLTGLEFAYGIPGSVGGAVYMNAGAYDGEMKQVLTAVTVLDERCLTIRTIPAAELALDYRHSCLMEAPLVALTAEFTLQSGNQADIQAKMDDLLGRRKSKQPLEYPSAGSTFKRPLGGYASKLIDDCGLKGYTAGGAQVSEKHAGFVINRGGATYADIMAVCSHVQQTVQAQTGFSLELEPEILQ